MGPTSQASDGGPVADGDPLREPDRTDDPVLAALREQGMHRLDPARFRYLEVLSRKAALQSGVLREQLDRRLAAVIAACQVQFEQARSESDKLLPAWCRRHPQAADDLRRLHGNGDFRAVRRLALRLDTAPRRGPLGELVGHIDQRPPEQTQGPCVATENPMPSELAPLVELKTVRDFRNTWAALRVDQQLTRSQAQVPQNPGPLNSHLLVLRSLRRMQSIAPAYVERFMAHVEALFWLDQADLRAQALPGKAARQESGKKNGKTVRRRLGASPVRLTTASPDTKIVAKRR